MDLKLKLMTITKKTHNRFEENANNQKLSYVNGTYCAWQREINKISNCLMSELFYHKTYLAKVVKLNDSLRDGCELSRKIMLDGLNT